MKQSLLSRNYLLITIGIIAVIIHGSLFPYDFTARNGRIGPVHELISTWAQPPTSFGDLVANILLYTPLGFFGVLAYRAAGWLRMTVVTLVGFVLCIAVELTQFYDVGRVTNMSDVYLNTLGTALGAFAGLLFADQLSWPVLRRIAAKPIPSLLLIAMLGDRLYPYVPTIDMHKYWNSLKPVLLTPSLPPYQLFRYAALWITIAYLLEAIADRYLSRLIYPLFFGFMILAKIFIETKVITVAELAGGSIAFLIWLMVVGARRQVAAALVAAILAAMIVLQRLEPFQFGAVGRHFEWMPFLSFMQGSLEANIQSFFEKFFLYGSLVWLLVEAGLRLAWSAGLVTAILFVTSQMEVFKI